ncbi:MAG: hypothetical protein RLY97_2068 [Pseudomonadota bacterium]
MRKTLSFLVLPLALTLASCDKKPDSTAPVAPADGSAIDKIAPPAGKTWPDVVAATADGGMLMGNPNAPIKLLEYGSLSCPHCAKFAQDGFRKLVDSYVTSGRVSYEFRSFAIHPQDVPLTVLARCSSPEAYFGLVEQVYINFESMNEVMAKGIPAATAAQSLPPAQRFVALSDALGYTDFFAARGVSRDQAHACLANLTAAEKVAKDSEKYSTNGIESTPTIIINGSKSGVNTWAEIEPMLQRAGAR